MNKTTKLLEEIKLISSFITNFNISEDFIEDLYDKMEKSEEPETSVVVVKDYDTYNGFNVFIMSPKDVMSITSDIWVSREFAWEVNDSDIIAEFGYLLALTVKEYVKGGYVYINKKA